MSELKKRTGNGTLKSRKPEIKTTEKKDATFDVKRSEKNKNKHRKLLRWVNRRKQQQ